ncbi:sugar ABC transporter [Pseudomonas amygdali pv. tabaci str. ATCC 11528]|uniref:Ribose ABC transporter ATP-binding protein n=1 Tax=Pseudomonas amygdali pv. hibisci TaxID=251723 RepID=A0AB34U442_PSEA0|nr:MULTISPECIES: sugar ABC transporter ATP-binding protein [Pseudomonas syringae group]KKY54055.1 sugar ABC transporter [Pseudomonas amygdali pv. tabaci str. ATCC 11528]KPX52978.1 Ribose ABC transporter ATP-binding protein [Pseudomonas amygdali pv. hibisci]MDU8605787.1 sugar ABC transporter ATP-binding protein [Pseudomonas syringae group sp. 247E2]MDU8648515.1 sugar ABC transporter ATP-binding protein [Pseudomonas syringae group sp. 26L6]QED84292.1 sugar ABC transporter ATP-binding protein [Ps
MQAALDNPTRHNPEVTPAAVLCLRNIGKTYGPVQVLSQINVDVRPGEVLALLGENGAGKSTLSSIIAGLVQPEAGGSMSWLGEDYAPASPGAALGAGIGLIHQEIRLLSQLSIAENIFVGRLPMRHGKVDRDYMQAQAQKQLERLGLDVSASRKVEGLSVAAQQLVEIAKALTLNARLLILDEPTAALGGEETELLFQQVERLKAEGVSFIYISHRLEEIARIADRILVLRDGRQIALHATAQVPVRELVEQMVGRSLERIFPVLQAPQDRVMLQVKDLACREFALHGIDFSVRAGEVFGIAGVVGAGRTELIRVIAGAARDIQGHMQLDGETVQLHSPSQAIQAGVVLVPEDRKQQGVVVEHRIEDNLVYGNTDLLRSGNWVSPKSLHAFARNAISRLGVKGAPEQRIDSLSGGNQQKVIIAKWLARNPKVFILDEPTRGIDVGARAAIYEVIAELAATGMAVIVVSSDLDEVLGLSHRVMVMSRGRQMGILERGEATPVSVMEMATA